MIRVLSVSYHVPTALMYFCCKSAHGRSRRTIEIELRQASSSNRELPANPSDPGCRSVRAVQIRLSDCFSSIEKIGFWVCPETEVNKCSLPTGILNPRATLKDGLSETVNQIRPPDKIEPRPSPSGRFLDDFPVSCYTLH